MGIMGDLLTVPTFFLKRKMLLIISIIYTFFHCLSESKLTCCESRAKIPKSWKRNILKISSKQAGKKCSAMLSMLKIDN